MGYLCMLGYLILIGMLSVTCGLLAGRISTSTLVASLTSSLLYSGLLLVGCWLLYQSIPPDPVVHQQAVGFLLTFGGFCLLIGGSLCAVVPIVLRRLQKGGSDVGIQAR